MVAVSQHQKTMGSGRFRYVSNFNLMVITFFVMPETID